MIKHVFIPSLAICTALSISAHAADAPAKAALCVACHGANGAAPIAPNYPKINGQNKAYLISAIKAYKSGDRKGGLSAVMGGQSKTLSNAEIDELAAYFASK